MFEQAPVALDEQTRRSIGEVLTRIPQSLFLMTAADKRYRRGVLVSLVQQVAFEPPMVAVALMKGRDIVPVLHNAHVFALNQIAPDDRVMIRRFSHSSEEEDALAAMQVESRVTGAPILSRALSYLDCEVVRHVDIDADHDLYVGMIRHAGVLVQGPPPPARFREDGFGY